MSVEPVLSITAPSIVQGRDSFPPGLVGKVAQFYYDSAPRPAHTIALAGGINFVAGLVGSAYNVRGTGLNLYTLVVADTGSGKDILSSACTKLMGSVAPSVPAIWNFRGPGDLVSYAGLYKAAIGRSSMHCIFNEFGKKMREMANGNNANLIGVQRIVLDAFSKSGFGEMILPSAYSDEKNRSLPPLKSFSLTITAETTPAIYEELGDDLISDGLLPRFLVFNHIGERAYLNENASSAVPAPELIQEIADVAAYSLATSDRKAVHNVVASPEAALLFKQFDVATTDLIRAAKTEVSIQLWNRAHLKALKLAALASVGINHRAPLISIEAANWAIKLVESQTKTLIAKFDSGNVGKVAGNETKQQEAVLKAIAQLAKGKDVSFTKDGRPLIYQSAIQQRLMTTAAFKGGLGVTFNIQKTIKNLVEAYALEELSMKDKIELGTKAKVFAMIAHNELIKAALAAHKT